MPVVRPLVLQSQREPHYRVTLQERVDGFFVQLLERAQSDEDLPGFLRFAYVWLAGSAAGDGADNVVDGPVHFTVREFLFPGGGNGDEDDNGGGNGGRGGNRRGDECVADITAKWIYVAHLGDRRFVAEIYAASPDDWRCWLNPTPENRDETRAPDRCCDEDGLELDLGESGGRRDDFGFLLSPVRLTRQGMDYLLVPPADESERDRLRETTVRPRWIMSTLAAVLLPDPFHWAVDAHTQFYLPAVEQWHAWVLDPAQEAKVFIASTLKAWIDTAEDAAGVGNNLQDGQPQAFLDKYHAEESSRRRVAEDAAAYLVHCIDTPEHRAIELSCKEAGERDLAMCFLQWGTVCARLADTEPGRRYALALVNDPTRMPREYLLDQSLPSNMIDFGLFREAWLAAVATVVGLTPALVKLAGDVEVDFAADMERIFLRLDFTVAVRDYDWLLHPHVTREFGLAPRSVVDARGSRAQQQWRRLVLETLEARDLENRFQRAARQMRRVHRNYVQAWEGRVYTAGVVVEAINLALAIHALAGSSDQRLGANSVALLGSVADAIESLAALGGQFARQAWNIPLKVLGSCAAFVGSLIDMFFLIDQGLDAAIVQHDYGMAVGLAIQAVGKGITAVGAAMVILGWLGAGAPLGPVGEVIAIVGAVVTVAGMIVVAALTKNDYEAFADGCFLGKGQLDAARYPAWAGSAFPTRSIRQEANVLLQLLANFKLSAVGSPWQGGRYNIRRTFLDILPGALGPDAQFRVWFEFRFSVPNAPFEGWKTFRSELRVDVREEHFEWIHPRQGGHGFFTPNLGRCQIERRGGGCVEHIRIALEPLSLQIQRDQALLYEELTPRDEPLTHWDYYHVRVQLRDGTRWVPVDGLRTVRVNIADPLGADDEVFSLDTTHWHPSRR